MKTKMTLRKLCWACLGRFEQLPKSEQEAFDRVWHRTMMVVRFTTDDLVTPTSHYRYRLEGLYLALGSALCREGLSRTS